jgi:hypothetical protein
MQRYGRASRMATAFAGGSKNTGEVFFDYRCNNFEVRRGVGGAEKSRLEL